MEQDAHQYAFTNPCKPADGFPFSTTPSPPEPVTSVTVDPSAVRNLARTSVRRDREKILALALGKILSVEVISWKDFCFTLYMITSKMVFRLVVPLERTNLAVEVREYDPWSLMWYPHAARLIEITVLKTEVDAGNLLEAQIVTQMREMKLSKTSANKPFDPFAPEGYDSPRTTNEGLLMGMDLAAPNGFEEEEL